MPEVPAAEQVFKADAARSPDTGGKAFRIAVRQLVRGVCIITHGQGDSRIGFTTTSVAPLSSRPPTLIFSLDQTSPLDGRVAPGELFGISVLGADHSEYADAFAGHTRLTQAELFEDRRWTTTVGGVSVLVDALSHFECEVEEVLERHSHAIVVGCVRSSQSRPISGALLLWRGCYDQIGWSAEQISRAAGLAPAAVCSGPEFNRQLSESQPEACLWVSRKVSSSDRSR